MKKFAAIAMMLIMCVGLLAGCGSSYAADESTVFVLKNGQIVSTDVEDFSEDTYDVDGLKTYVKDAVDTYNKKNGKDTVSFKKLSTKDNKATLTLEYDSATDYQKFNDITLFTGSVAEALAAGYSFDTDFASVSDKEIKACDKNEFLNDASYKVVVIQANTNVSVKGTIAYVSVQNTNYIDSKTIAIREGTSIFNNGKENNTEATETQEGKETVAETENTEQAVSEDDLLNATTEETEKVFDFSEDTAENKTDSEFSQVYTYIIYK